MDIIIPFYKTEELVTPLFESLMAVRDEINALGAQVIAVNDSPDYRPLQDALMRAKTQIGDQFPLVIDNNDSNMGFVRSCNRAMARSVAARRDILLLNSDTYVFPGALTALVDIAGRDPMIGFVSPRSNNATICNLPHDPAPDRAAPHAAFAAYRKLAASLPDFDYVPTVVGFCLYMKAGILAEIGLFDEIYSPGYHEENDLIRRGNRFGYCAAIANRGFVWHKSSQSFTAPIRDSLNERNTVTFSSRYPEYDPLRLRYMNGPAYRAEALLTPLLPDAQGRLDIGFNFLHFGCHYNGTFEAALNILRGMAEQFADAFNFFVVVHDNAAKFHQIDKIANVTIISPYVQRNFALYLLIGQPFSNANLIDLSLRAPLIGVMMMDTIALDCGYIEPERDLPSIWRFAFDHFDGMAFISQFSEDQFRRRFPFRESLHSVMCSLSLRRSDYRAQQPADGREPAPEPGYWFLIGNHFAHKAIPQTLAALSEAFPEQRIVVLGVDNDLPPNAIGYAAGHVSESLVERLYRGASLVIFPSHYEGFGFPILKALSFEKPILVRHAPASIEMIAHLAGDPNIHLFDNSQAMIATLKQGLPIWRSGHPESDFGWDQCAATMGNLCRRILSAGTDRERISRRLAAIDLLLLAERGRGAPALQPSFPRLRAFFGRHPALRQLVRPFWRLAVRLRQLVARL